MKMKKPRQFSNLKPVSDDNNNNKLELRLGPPVAPPPLVGWPPVGSFRKNLANNNSFTKPYKDDDDGKCCETKEYMFVKINMEGIPIGRKVDLKAYDSYDKLSIAIDQLFIGLLAVAAQGDSSTRIASGGEYTLVYEDYEGDTVLVGDVPWKMFVSTAKRLRVLKSSEIWSLQRKTPL